MSLSDFSSLFELAAGLNIAFVAVEISKGYTYILYEKVFRFGDRIHKAIEEIRKPAMVNQTSLNCMEPIDLGGKSTLVKIEEAKRDYEAFIRDGGEAENRMKASAEKLCDMKSFSVLSLCMFLYCCVLLFVSGFQDSGCLKFGFDVFTVFIFIYMIFGWWCGEKYDWSIYIQLRKVLWVHLVCVILSAVVTFLVYLNYRQILIGDNIQNIFIMLASLIPFLNFIVFYFIIKNKMSEMRGRVDETLSALKKRGEILDEKFNTLNEVKKISMELHK